MLLNPGIVRADGRGAWETATGPSHRVGTSGPAHRVEEAMVATACVLFVDDEPAVLSGLRRVLRTRCDDWDLEFADSGRAALDILARRPVDIVVSDMRMPGMNGAGLLSHVQARHPGTGRLMLSGHAERDAVVSAVGPTQQYLSKPVETDLLVDTIQQMLATRSLVCSPRLQAVLGTVTTLPKPPSVLVEVLATSRDPDSSVEDVAAIIQHDVGAVAEILHLVNSGFFGLPTQVDGVEQAVSLLGLDTIEALAMAGAVFGPGAPVPVGLDLAAFSARAMEVASTCRRISELEGWPADVRADLFLAGLMNEVGLLALAVEWPDRWASLRAADPGDLSERHVLEQAAFGCSVTEASAFLLSTWGFRRGIVELLAAQPCHPDDRPQKPPAAQVLALARGWVSGAPRELTLIENGWLDAARLQSWLQSGSNQAVA